MCLPFFAELDLGNGDLHGPPSPELTMPFRINNLLISIVVLQSHK